MKKDFVHYEPRDIVAVVCPLHPLEGMIGTIYEASNEKMRYLVRFDDGISDSFSWNQIKHHRSEDDLDALIDLSLTLGEAGVDLFEDWSTEKILRFHRPN
ncbi:hypothetical protein PUW25_26100 (plasmid) [Paenibacillus urinalis]|uniref:DUF4926 domain-containing protein n=1 Tax=Paenibacillus urinalis TaxID=521520 RepID=A0ABY7XH13_9BACL|nr:hypothetical protein [Paenibacillus urinalis]WDI05044.1 hypothetical protein PUW25_26100 [Paenibacillus urinalis]